VPLLGEGLDEVVVVGGDGPEIGGRHPGRLACLLEESDDTGGVLQDLDDAVEEDAVEARVIEADGRLMVLDEGVHGGPPWGWVSSLIIPRSAYIWPTFRTSLPHFLDFSLSLYPDSLEGVPAIVEK
jgi:hypothetical protein